MSSDQKAKMMQQVAAAHVNSIPIAPADTPEAFIQTATHWLGGWWQKKAKWNQITPGYCALIFDPEFDSNVAFKNFELVTLFREAPSANLGGAIYVTDGVLGKVYRKRDNFPDANAIVQQVKALNMQASSIVLFEPEVGAVLYSAQGVGAPMTVLQLGAFEEALTVENVDKQLMWLYDSTLKYPTDFPHAWFDRKKLIPSAFAEKLFQSTALIHLRAVAHNFWQVRPEDQNNAGRTDLSISALNPTRVFVMEIKVLKSFKYSAKKKLVAYDENEDWAEEGIDQVIKYRKAQNAESAFLLLYDMRKKDEPFTCIDSRCTTQQIESRRYFIHNETPAQTKKAAKKAVKKK